MHFLDQFQEKSDTQLLIGPDNIIRQTFISKHDNLAGIRLYLANPNLGGKQEYLVQIADGKDVVREETVSESNIGWNMTLRLDFSPITNSMGKEYQIILLSLRSANGSYGLITLYNQEHAKIHPDILQVSSGEVNSIEKSYVHVAYNTQDDYPFGAAKLNSTTLSGDIVFETYYQTSIISATRNILNHTVSRMWIDKPFFFIYFLLIFLMCIFIVYSLRLRKSN